MGLGKLKSAFKKVKSGWNKLKEGVKKVWKNPIFQTALSIGSMFIPGLNVATGLKALGSLGSLGGALSSFGGFAAKFFPQIQSFLQGPTMKMLTGFLGQANNTSDLASMAMSLFNARQGQTQQLDGMGDAKEMAMANAQQIFASIHARLIADMQKQQQPQFS